MSFHLIIKQQCDQHLIQNCFLQHKFNKFIFWNSEIQKQKFKSLH